MKATEEKPQQINNLGTVASKFGPVSGLNGSGTESKIDTPLTPHRSGPVRFELVDYRGLIHGPYTSRTEAMAAAQSHWPDQEQDEDRTGKGWDVQVAGLRD